ncbi:hypothetical protein SCLCIDRAFT_32448 [Scleroderma citrinum Foug A]|uniref:Ubiquitin-like protease family profile domain-containing protein n=1 Tax=Scleroderma citrinum Foug A TaxID=1036808 RepID=A0A0C2YSK3_9AGAM|nr:hypothetical protein SCLCIDRAFT_32448 [Scleroderma citrinum Foug A]
MYFIPKAQVDEVGQQIKRACKQPPKQQHNAVSDEAIDQCEVSYEAADGNKEKAAMECFNDTGIMVLICRHDIPLFFVNVDTPGEQQKYSVALLQHLFSYLPSMATVVVLYDVGCILACSLEKYNILDDDIISRIHFATTAMHAYGHEWACQLIYNPRIIQGLGLSDGEGTERLWSRFIKLIGIERASSRQRWIWLIDRQAAAIGLKMRDDLGDWIRRRLRKGIAEQGTEAQHILSACGVDIPELWNQWSAQRTAQLSVHAHVPARLKQELDTVLLLQADLESSDKALQATWTIIAKDAKEDTLQALESLEHGHVQLLNKVDALFASLNIHDRFPALHGVSLEFICTLLLVRDLKINIRKRAIGSFFEWDKLDCAVGGKQKALGTKLHQQTRKAIAKHQPALMSSIHKFNTYCERLAELYDASSSIPLPSPLPTKLTELRNDQSLLQDVWVTPSIGEVPRWLEDANVREGIRAILKSDRCLEEQHRLGMEADNMCWWFGRKLCAIELALQQAEILQQRRESLSKLQERWPTPLVSAVRYASQVSTAMTVAASLSGAAMPLNLQWLSPVLCTLPADNLSEDIGLPLADLDPIEPVLDPDQIALADILEDTEAHPNINEDDLCDIEEDLKNALSVDFVWQIPFALAVDMLDINSDMLITFEADDYECLASPTAHLNDTCVNGCSALLFSEFLSSTAAQYDALWRNISWTRYWEKPIWILPIHCPSPVRHWVVCIIKFASKQLLLFDSLAEQRPWKHNIMDIMQLISSLSFVASKKLRIAQNVWGSWSAYPIVTNGYDCGLWVLAQVAAVLWGRDITNLREEDMGKFRRYLQSLILSIPIPGK